jgi:mannose-6-phosphate isomerase-like protein (cupin superfamily)
MIESVTVDGLLLALIIRSTFQKEGITFFTPQDYSQQLGYMNRPKGYIIPPHVHKLVERKVTLTQEVLYVKSGKVRVDFYNDDQVYLESRTVETGDVILLAAGGHGFEMLASSELIEIKQGPYCGDEDKVRFDHTPEKINLIPKK